MKRLLKETCAKVSASVVLLVILFVTFIDAPWRQIPVGVSTLLVLAVFYVLLNFYMVLLARPNEWFDETLIGLWIRAKKASLKREIE